MTPDHFFTMVLDQTISTSTPATTVNLAGYREYAVLARFEGPPLGDFRMEINNNQQLVTQEKLQLNESGWLNFARTYRVYAPNVGIVIYHPPANLNVRMSIYAGM